MMERAIGISGSGVDEADLMMERGETRDIRGWDQLQCLLVGGCRLGEVASQFLCGFPRLPGVAEPVIGDRAELAGHQSATECAIHSETLKSMLVPVLGLIQVARAEDVVINMPEIVGSDAFRRTIADPLVQAHRLEEGVQAAGFALMEQDVAESFDDRC